MSDVFELSLRGARFPIDRHAISSQTRFFNAHPELATSPSYVVQSPVSLDLLKDFVSALEHKDKFTVTDRSAASLALLANEFTIPALQGECSRYAKSLGPGSISAIEERLFNMECRYSTLKPPKRAFQVDDCLSILERQLLSLAGSVSEIEASLSQLKNHLNISSLHDNLQSLRTDLDSVKSQLSTGPMVRTNTTPSVSIWKRWWYGSEPAEAPPPPTPTPTPTPAIPAYCETQTSFELNTDQPLNGIMTHLARKHGGNLNDLKVVTITSSSYFNNDPQNAPRVLGDIAGPNVFVSNNEQNQWVCWDFHGIRITPTHYTIQTADGAKGESHLQSWILEGSLDSLTWSTIDIQKNNRQLNNRAAIAWFRVNSQVESRFIRLTQTGRNHHSIFILAFRRFELFGNLRSTDQPVAPIVVRPPYVPTRQVDCPANTDAPLDGMIAYLTQSRRGNLYERGIVTVTVKSILRDDDPMIAVKNLVDLNSDGYFASKDEAGQWICWTFRDIRIRPTNYSIRSRSGPSVLKSWVIEGSIDGIAWVEIDRREGIDHLKNGNVRMYQITNRIECSSIRLTQVGPNHGETDFLVLTSFEVFGTLLE
jgi:hypothetical protein